MQSNNNIIQIHPKNESIDSESKIESRLKEIINGTASEAYCL
jgi:hypothetical protein